MKTYTAIALLSLLGITLSASAAQAFESSLPMLETATAQYMLSAQTQHKGNRPPQRGGGRRNFTESNVYTHPLQDF
ncbi:MULTISPECIES: heterocyst-inhibiting protein PatX [unclassified Microcoleus]|uniref:heterocyst-inhibiting protein PatX n=1 Tax=unclassified Microcoleus TaxID=2642155 RepID=UPI002FD0C2F0